VATGSDWCDVELPSRVNQVALLQGEEGIFVAAACNDGSLPVLVVKTKDDEDPQEQDARRAIMAIEPIEGPVAGEERYKCIHTVCGYYVVTANSAGIVSLMNLEGAIRMITSDEPDEDPAQSDSVNEDKDENNDDDSGADDLAVDIIDAVQLGTGARVTCLVAWACETDDQDDSSVSDKEHEESVPVKQQTSKNASEGEANENEKKRKLGGNHQNLEMDPSEVEKARALVAKAKKMQKRKDSKKRRKLVPEG